MKKETLGQLFSYDFCQISKNKFFTEHMWTTASKKSCDSQPGVEEIQQGYFSFSEAKKNGHC